MRSPDPKTLADGDIGGQIDEVASVDTLVGRVARRIADVSCPYRRNAHTERLVVGPQRYEPHE